MVFEQKNFAQIFEAMRDRTGPTLTDFQEGSVVRTMFESFAYEIALLYAQMEKVYLSAYVDTASGVQLEQVVAILGIKRGEPDFATGKVTFTRDIGIDEDILIPIGTLVTNSEDTASSPKKAYKTIEAQTLSRNTTTVDVRVQAVQRGESQKTDAKTIVVMPQPIAGVKSVINKEPILFTGKRQETDQELRDRAKKTLLAASGANTTAIEQALISLPGVKQVQVRENFHYAKGEVTLTINGTSQPLTIPKDTELKIGQQSFKTTKQVNITSSPVKVNVEAVVAGQAGQLTQATNSPTTNNIESKSISVINEQPIILKDFGIIEVFVDGVDFSDTAKVSELQQVIDRVRAAGIYVLLKPAIPVTIDGVFKIELASGLKLPKPEIIELEEEIQKAIQSYIIEQKMGQPLLISQLTKKVLEINGVNDITDFTLEIFREIGISEKYKSSSKPVKQLSVDILEKFTPGLIRVASEIKPLLVNLDIYLKSQNLTAPLNQAKTDGSADRLEAAIFKALVDYFENHQSEIKKSELEAEIAKISVDNLASQSITIGKVDINLKPQFWQPGLPFNGTNIDISFVEKAQVGKLFIYNKVLQITGAFQLTLPATSQLKEKQEIYQAVRSKLAEYLNTLKPEEKVNIEKLLEIAKSVDKVLDVTWKLDDFQVRLNNEIVDDRIDKKEIRVDKFEKAQLADNFAINSDIELISIKIDAIKFKLNYIGAVVSEINQQQLQQVMRQAIVNIFDDTTLNQSLPKLAVGQNLDYAQFQVNLLVLIREKVKLMSRQSILNLVSTNITNKEQLADLTISYLRNSDYSIVQLNLLPENLKLSTGDILIRSIERAQIYPISKDKVTVEIDIPPVTAIPAPDVTNLINQGKAIESRIPPTK